MYAECGHEVLLSRCRGKVKKFREMLWNAVGHTGIYRLFSVRAERRKESQEIAINENKIIRRTHLFSVSIHHCDISANVL